MSRVYRQYARVIPKGTSKEVTKILRKASKAGWEIPERGGNGHIKCYSPDGETVVIVSPNPKGTSLRKIKKDFSKGGLNIA